MGTRINTAVAGRAALAVLLAVVLAGCAAQSAREAEAPAQARPPASLPAESAARPAAGAPAQDIATIVAMLEDGRMSEGREALRVLLAREPGNALARSLVRQLDSDPVALLGAEHQPYTVRAGDTLGGLAARHLGDSSLFVALARYNNISRPRLLAVGQTLKIPRRGALAPPSATPTLPAAGNGEARPAVPPPAAADGAAQRWQQRVDAELAAGQYAAAGDSIARARREAPAGGAWEAWLRDAERRRSELGRSQVAAYHEAAVVHFRNQQLDEAIALWDRALAIDPGFQPALGYRVRALELKRRLQELDSSGG